MQLSSYSFYLDKTVLDPHFLVVLFNQLKKKQTTKTITKAVHIPSLGRIEFACRQIRPRIPFVYFCT